MLDTISIWRLYANVLHNDVVLNQIQPTDIRLGVQNMGKAYSPESANFNSTAREFPNFNNSAFRCAYLHKYAPLHTYIVLDVMLEIIEEKRFLFAEMIRTGKFNICCLGGGPGTDVIGVLAALYDEFNSFKSSATVIDCMKEWELTFASLVEELMSGDYGEMWYNLAQNFHWNYIDANLLQNMTNEVNKAIASASFVTMVKFVSATICTNTEAMLEKIFRVMKPGALVLFIDNAAGGFTQAVERASKKNCFELVIPPRRHVAYENEQLKSDRFGYTSCFKSTVTILLLKKPLSQQNRRTRYALPTPQSNSQNSYVAPIRNDNLNHILRETDPDIYVIGNDYANVNQLHSPYSSPYTSPIQEDNFYCNTDFSAVNNASVINNNFRSSYSSAISQPVSSISIWNTSQYYGRHANQQFDNYSDDNDSDDNDLDDNDLDDNSCTCCVIS